MTNTLQELESQLKGELYYDDTMRTLYATDASAYREFPLAVAIPKVKEDIKTLIEFARKHKTSLIPRTAGTSLAGQVVGKGIVVDVSRKFTSILEVNQEESWVRLEPGVVRDELNYHLAQYNLFFGPETSTANRAMIGGMVGNNSCGSNSIIYGSTREHLISVKGYLSDGAEVEFKTLSIQEFEDKCAGKDVASPLEQEIYKSVKETLSDKNNQVEIRESFPKPDIPRRNTGYALDLLLETAPFTDGKDDFNFCKLIAGSEGTLIFITEIKIHVDPTPPKHKALVCAHFNTIDEALRANILALDFSPSACELMDHYILECTKANIEHRQNRFFVQGDPGAILVVELSRDDEIQLESDVASVISVMNKAKLGYHFPVVLGPDIKKVWNLRKAGLGLLSNIPGDAKPAPVIEDTAVDVHDLPAYIADFNEVLKQYGLFCVHYAHAGTGELHLRPILNLKTEEGNKLFRTIAEEIAKLVKKYRGSLSGEHGDGRLRGEFIKYMVGEKSYKLIETVKRSWDPENIFNPGKIVDTPSMNTSLRYAPGQSTPDFDTVFRFDEVQGVLRAAELCNGSGDCRKSELTGGTMCPSYMATRNEKDTTRARANILREYLTQSDKANPFDHKEIHEVMDLCLSCKGCKSECPSNVDMGKLKAEFLHQYYKENGVSLRSKLISNFSALNSLAAVTPGLYNFTFSNPLTSKIAKSITGFAPERSIPLLHKTTLKKWFKKRKKTATDSKKKVYFFCDEFTNFNDVPIGQKAIQLLEKLGYEVIIPTHVESGRTFLSKGILLEAKELAIRNVNLLKDLITNETPLIGLEPSAILTFRDEYPELVHEYMIEDAKKLAENCLTFEEFFASEIDKGEITKDAFNTDEKLLKVHGHCHQKALSSLVPTKKMLSLPENYQVHMIPSGCCGMAGSFGYEKEHYELSMKVGELVLFPTVRKQPEEVIIAAAGTSCRHQIKDGTKRLAKHPAEILFEALK
ncbi:FAD-binding and (Fe-S)-binding domain-containing protein [Chondrinema litorale]|uniref:FAD-binding and (Fe-S)-binding domain-containing protein n=1 Tax=Chondrinema litorale TaxID=2994555 RepID=UPI0025431ABE|nr:FAD-binding and (Fe-S)-binding domain-containing protein [Chondrinema litorale]UZR94696.1 FAD-binding and (Fe-S)-binding domain-containing protein [Chondrinema litorale]